MIRGRARETRGRRARERESAAKASVGDAENARRRDERATTLGDARSSARGDDEEEDDESVV